MPTLEEARTWYQQPDASHGFSHIERVYHLAEQLAAAEGADLEIVRAAALLHDARGSAPGTQGRIGHHLRSAGFASQVLKSEGWPPDRIAAVQHCIRAHRFRSGSDVPVSPEARVLFDADKLDVLGAFGVARTIAYAAVAGEPIHAEPSRSFLQSGEKEPGEPHSAYHEYLLKLRKIKDTLFTSTAQALAVQRHDFMVNFFHQLAFEASFTLPIHLHQRYNKPMSLLQGPILVVEDISNVLDMLTITLRFKGYPVLTARDGEAALDIIANKKPVLVITDILMPRMDGYALAYNIRTNPETRSTRIIFLSATYTSPEDKDFALSLGASRFIEKPIDADNFLLTVAEVLTEDAASMPLPPDEATFHRGYRTRLENKLRSKKTQISRTENLLSVLPEDQKVDFETLLREFTDERDNIQTELEELIQQTKE